MSLRLERTSQKANLTFTFQKRAGLCTKEFALAFLIALGVHLAALFIFHIDLGMLLKLTNSSPPFNVTSDLSQGLIGIETVQGKPQNIPLPLEILRKASPGTPHFFLQTHADSLMNESASISSGLDLSGLEFNHAGGPCEGSIHFSRGVTLKNPLKPLKSQKFCKASLAYKAHGETGEIFWLNWIESTGDKRIDQEVENTLKSARLGLSSTLVFDGVVDVEFKP